MQARAEQRRDRAGHDRRRQPVLRRQAGEGGEGEALRQDEERAEQAGDGVGAEGGAVDRPDPGSEQARRELDHGPRLCGPREDAQAGFGFLSIQVANAVMNFSANCLVSGFLKPPLSSNMSPAPPT